MEWARPWALALLPLVPLALWAWWRRPRPAIGWPDAATLAPLAVRGVDRGRLALRAVALTCAVLALAGPRWPSPGEQLEAEGIAIMLVVDVSGSMAEPDFQRNGEKISRLDSVKSAFRDFVARRTQDRLGLVLFATHPETACPLTLDHSALLRRLAGVNPRGLPTESETNLGDALAWGLDRLATTDGRRVMIICSDGEHNVPSPALTPRQAGQLAAAAGVPIYSVFAGPSAGAGLPGLEAVARMTGGASFAANDAAGLNDACAAIDVLERDVARNERTRKYVEVDHWLAIAACCALIAALAMDRGPWLTIGARQTYVEPLV